MNDTTITFTPQEIDLLKKAVREMVEMHEPGSELEGIGAIKKQYEALAAKINEAEPFSPPFA